MFCQHLWAYREGGWDIINAINPHQQHIKTTLIIVRWHHAILQFSCVCLLLLTREWDWFQVSNIAQPKQQKTVTGDRDGGEGDSCGAQFALIKCVIAQLTALSVTLIRLCTTYYFGFHLLKKKKCTGMRQQFRCFAEWSGTDNRVGNFLTLSKVPS